MVTKHILSTAIILSLICSCTSEDIIDNKAEQPKLVTSLTASFAEPTRTQYVDDYQNNVLRVTWKGDEKIRVYSQGDNEGTEYSCNNQVTTDGKTAVFSGNAELSGTCTAVYPSTADRSGTVDFSNQLQKENNNTEHLADLDVMKCEFDPSNSVLTFNHQIAIMKVVLRHDAVDGIKSISLSGAWGENKYTTNFTKCTIGLNHEVIAYFAVDEGHISAGSIIANVLCESGAIHTYISPVIPEMTYTAGNMYTANFYSYKPELSYSDSFSGYHANRAYVDLGLPSGNLWSCEEISGDYSVRFAVWDGWKFAGIDDYAELVQNCEYSDGYLISKSNGNRIKINSSKGYFIRAESVKHDENGFDEYFTVFKRYNLISNTVYTERIESWADPRDYYPGERVRYIVDK